MHAADKPRDAIDIDKVVSSELPDPALFPLAHQTVYRHMVHGPCGELDPNAV